MSGPYVVGDRIDVLHSCEGAGTEVATLTVERVKALAVNGRWRISTTRCDGRPLEVEVGRDGRDRNGYVRKAGAR